MISLITISCIAAAFTPVITKKLKNQRIYCAQCDGTKPCEPCPAGSYSNTDGAHECIKCPVDATKKPYDPEYYSQGGN